MLRVTGLSSVHRIVTIRPVLDRVGLELSSGSVAKQSTARGAAHSGCEGGSYEAMGLGRLKAVFRSGSRRTHTWRM